MSGGAAQRRREISWWWVCLLLLLITFIALFVRPIGSGTKKVRFSKGVMHGVRIGTMDYFAMFPMGGNAAMATFGRGESRMMSPLKFTGKSGSWGTFQVIIGSPSFTRHWMIAL